MSEHEFHGEPSLEWLRGYAAGRAVTPDDLRRARASVDRSVQPLEDPTPSVWPHSTPEPVRRLSSHQTTPGRVTMTFTTMTKGDA